MATVVVSAQWALWGVEAGDSGNRQLACCSGAIGPHKFAEVVLRYSPDTLYSRSQVTIGWLRDTLLRGLIAVGIYDRVVSEAALDLPAVPLTAVDAHGRAVTQTNLYCVLFSDIARHDVSCPALYEAFSTVRLPAESRKPVIADLAIRPGLAQAPGEFALRIAALLLNGRPVCVFGAEHLTVTERLRFLDSVASLLPYGMRAMPSAATWASRTSMHWFRLFFATAPRSREQDVAVTWEQAETVGVADCSCAAYLSWLQADTAQWIGHLAVAVQPMGFAPADVWLLLSWAGTEAPGATAPTRPRTPIVSIGLAAVVAGLLLAALLVIAEVAGR